MKKSLLSLLAISLAVVGCQNYDDQFDDLNSQIAALSSQVAGLAQVQSDLASLAGTVSSLQSTVASTATAIEGLDGLAENVAAIQESVNDVASSEEVADIAADLDSAQDDLQDLLDQSSVFTNNVVVNSVATLDVYHKMGSSLNVVAGNVEITAKSDMDATKLQELVDNIYTTTGHYTYEANSSTVGAVTFNNLTGTQTLTVNQAGDYNFQTLGSATVINLKDTYKSKVTVIHFGELTSVQKFQTNGTDNTISFSKATELHLTKLAYYPPNNLTIVVDEGAAMPFIVDDVDASGDQADITLDITGPASLSFTNILDGTIALTDVKAATINGFEGGITIGKGVETFSADKVVTLTLTGTLDLETMDITGAVDPDVSTSVGPALTLENISSLETVDVDGVLSSLTVKTNGNVTDLTIAADVAGTIDLDGNTDLTTVALTGAKATALDVDGNTDLEALTVDLTWRAGTSTGAVIDGDIIVNANTSLETLAISSDNLENLTITGNDDLTSVDMNGVTVAGATGSPAINISNNDLSATLVDKDDTASSSTGDGEANDLGSVSNSGIKNASTYLTAVAADTDASVVVLYDTVDFTTEADATSEVSFASGTANASQDTKLRLAYIVPNTADAGDAATKMKRSFILDGAGVDLDNIHVNNTALYGSAGITGNLSGNPAVAVSTAGLLTTDALALADAAGVTYTATAYAGNQIDARLFIGLNSSSTENSATAATAKFAYNASDTFTVSLDGLSITVTSTGAGTTSLALVNAIMAEWERNYPATASAAVVDWVVTSGTDAIGKSISPPTGYMGINFRSKSRGSSNIGQTLTATHSAGKTATFSNVGIIIGNGQAQTSASGDNMARGLDIMVTFEADTAGTGLSEIGSATNTQAAAGVSFSGAGVTANLANAAAVATELGSSYKPNSTASYEATATNAFVSEDRDDVRQAENAINAATSNASSFSRIGWL